MDVQLASLDPMLVTLKWLGVWLCLSSAVTYALFGIDRRRAERGWQRLPEGNLLWLSTLGGWPGAILGLRRSRGVAFSGTFRGWLRGIVAAELLFLGMATLPQGSLVVVAESVASVAMGSVSARERETQPGRVVLDSDRRLSGSSNLVTLSGKP